MNPPQLKVTHTQHYFGASKGWELGLQTAGYPFQVNEGKRTCFQYQALGRFIRSGARSFLHVLTSSKHQKWARKI